VLKLSDSLGRAEPTPTMTNDTFETLTGLKRGETSDRPPFQPLSASRSRSRSAADTSTSNGEVMFAVIDDPDPLKLMHRLAEILRARILAIACEDANDLDRPDFGPAFKLTRGDCRIADWTCARSLPSRR
jgi:hypothetical protein